MDQEKKETQTWKKRAENYWYYYKIHTVIGLFVLLLVGITIRDKMRQIEYDYCIGVITESDVQYEQLEQLQKVFESYAEDYNEDGEVHVQVEHYMLGNDESMNPQINMANQTKFSGDIQMGQSMIYIYSDEIYKEFMSENIFDVENEEPIRLADCAGYAAVTNAPALDELYISLRSQDGMDIADDEKLSKYYEASKKLFERFESGNQ